MLASPIDGLVVYRGRHAVGRVIRGKREGDAAFLERARITPCEGAIADILREAWRPPAPAAPVPSLTIAVCTHERPQLLERLLASLAAMDAHPALQPEFIVVDNAPKSEATRAAVMRHHAIGYVREPLQGLDFARNAAWRAASGDFVAYLDDDVVVEAGWLHGYVRAMAAHPDAGALTGLVLPYSLQYEAQVMFERPGGFGRGFLPRRSRGPRQSRDGLFPLGAGQFGAGCNMVIRRALIEVVGGFDDALDTGAPLPGGGDLDSFFKVLSAGAALVYEPSMAVRHEHRRDIVGLRRQYWSWGLGFFAFLESIRQREPARGDQVRAIRRWWWADWMWRTVRAALGGGDTPLRMVLAEGTGAIQGRFGEYQRSRARVQAIRRGTQ